MEYAYCYIQEGKLETVILYIDNLISKIHMPFDDALAQAFNLLNVFEDIKKMLINILIIKKYY